MSANSTNRSASVTTASAAVINPDPPRPAHCKACGQPKHCDGRPDCGRCRQDAARGLPPTSERCTTCRRPKDQDGFKSCPKCREMGRAWRKVNKRTHCQLCLSAAPINGRTTCERCCELLRQCDEAHKLSSGLQTRGLPDPPWWEDHLAELERRAAMEIPLFSASRDPGRRSRSYTVDSEVSRAVVE